jgi:MFS family permease
LVVDALLLAFSAAILRGVQVKEQLAARSGRSFKEELLTGLRFVRGHVLLPKLAMLVGAWQLCHNAALVVQILVATRELGMSPSSVGLSYVGLGVGTVLASLLGHRISERLGPGPCLVSGIAISSLGWGVLALAPSGPLGVAAFALMLALFGVGAVLIFINFLSLRQAVTPSPLLGRMTSTMRWLILLPAAPGALLGGWLGEHFGLRSSLAFASLAGLAVAAYAWRSQTIQSVRRLPQLEEAAATA